MLIKVKNLTVNPVSLPGPLPRLSKSQLIIVEITPENFDLYREELAALQANNIIDLQRSEAPGSGYGRFEFKDATGEIYWDNIVVAAPGVTTDERVKVTSADTIADFLVSKLQSGSGISLSVINPGLNEKLQISAPGSTTDEKVKITTTDTTPDYLNSKVTVAGGVTKTIVDAGLDEKLQLSSPSLIDIANAHKILRQLIHFINDGPAEGFASGAYREIVGTPFPLSVIWYENVTKAKKIVSVNFTRNIQNQATTVQWKVYDTDGSTILATVTDTIVYLGPWETSRTRTIA